MALPSQTGRTSGPSARVTHRRNRRTRRHIILFVMIVAAGGGGWWWWRSTDNHSPQTSPQTPLATTAVPIPAVVTNPTSQAPPEASPKTPATKPQALPHTSLDPALQTKGHTARPTQTPTAHLPQQAPRETLVTLPEIDPQTLTTINEPSEPSIEPDLPDLTNASVAKKMNTGLTLIQQGQLVKARALLSQLLFDPQQKLAKANAKIIRTELTKVNEELVFSRRIAPHDPLALTYTVKAGDYLGPIAKEYRITYPLIEQINQVKATRIWPGLKLKILRGPFHLIIDKTDYRMDVFAKHPTTGQRLFIASYPVGLGEQDSTPIGQWIVKPAGKAQNPSWPDPRTGKFYKADDPKNPIGEYWIGLAGTDDRTQGKQGYGIHGTIDSDSIGQQRSMGCIRMLDKNLNRVFNLLVERDSTVEIQR